SPPTCSATSRGSRTPPPTPPARAHPAPPPPPPPPPRAPPALAPPTPPTAAERARKGTVPFVARWRGHRTALVLVLAAGSLGALAMGAGGERPAAPRALPISFLDVGQGDAALVQRDGVSVLVDTGPPGGPILQQLEEAHISRLDALVVTHQSADHDGGSAAGLRQH